MNRQVNYIVHASLILLLVSTGFFLIKQFSLSQPVSDNYFLPTNTGQKAISIPANFQQGKTLFMGKCASCHNVFKATTGPPLLGFENTGPWTDRKKLYAWIRNPAAFMKKDAYTKKLFEQYGSMMQAFPELTDAEIDAICDYLNYQDQPRL